MSGSDILANMARGWNRTPSGVALGTERTGVSAALWPHDTDDVQEVSAEPDPSRYIVSLPSNIFSASMFFDGRLSWKQTVRPGTCTIVAAGTRPRAIHQGRFSVLHVYVPRGLVESACEAVERSNSSAIEWVDPACSSDLFMERIRRDVLAEIRSRQPLSGLRVDVLGQDIAIHLLRHHSNLVGTGAISREVARGGLAPWQVERICNYLQEHLADDVRLDDLAGLLGISSFHLCRAFRKATGMPPHRWRMQRRVERARQMLADGDLPVAEIALSVGYDDPSQFAAAFRKIVGVSPAQYRRERTY